MLLPLWCMLAFFSPDSSEEEVFPKKFLISKPLALKLHPHAPVQPRRGFPRRESLLQTSGRERVIPSLGTTDQLGYVERPTWAPNFSDPLVR